MFYINFCTITSLILTFFLYNFQLWWCCASNNLREDHWWSLLHMRGGDNVTSDSNHAGQESHCQKIAFAWTSNAFSISFPESVWMKGATRRGLEQRARERENHKDEASGVTHRMHDLLKRGARCTNATTGTKLRRCGMQWWRVGIAVMESCMNKVMPWVQAEAQLSWSILKECDYLKGMNSQWSSSSWVDYCVLAISRKVFTQGTFYFPHYLWWEQHICSRLTSLCCSVRRINKFFFQSQPNGTLRERKRITARFSFRVRVLEKYVFKGNAEILCLWFARSSKIFRYFFKHFFKKTDLFN